VKAVALMKLYSMGGLHRGIASKLGPGKFWIEISEFD